MYSSPSHFRMLMYHAVVSFLLLGSLCLYVSLLYFRKWGKFFFYPRYVFGDNKCCEKDKISLEKGQHFKTLLYPLLGYN